MTQVGEMWQNASEEEKSPYVAMSNQDKARYQAELESYNFRYNLIKYAMVVLHGLN